MHSRSYALTISPRTVLRKYSLITSSRAIRVTSKCSRSVAGLQSEVKVPPKKTAARGSAEAGRKVAGGRTRDQQSVTGQLDGWQRCASTLYIVQMAGSSEPNSFRRCISTYYTYPSPPFAIKPSNRNGSSSRASAPPAFLLSKPWINTSIS